MFYAKQLCANNVLANPSEYDTMAIIYINVTLWNGVCKYVYVQAESNTMNQRFPLCQTCNLLLFKARFPESGLT